MKTLKLEVTIKFSEKVANDDDIKIIVENVLNGLMKQNDEAGISPDGSDGYVEMIEVNEPFSGISTDISYV